MSITLSDDGKCLIMKDQYSISFCAVGSSSPWPQNWIIPPREASEEELEHKNKRYAYYLDGMGYGT